MRELALNRSRLEGIATHLLQLENTSQNDQQTLDTSANKNIYKNEVKNTVKEVKNLFPENSVEYKLFEEAKNEAYDELTSRFEAKAKQPLSTETDAEHSPIENDLLTFFQRIDVPFKTRYAAEKLYIHEIELGKHDKDILNNDLMNQFAFNLSHDINEAIKERYVALVIKGKEATTAAELKDVLTSIFLRCKVKNGIDFNFKVAMHQLDKHYVKNIMGKTDIDKKIVAVLVEEMPKISKTRLNAKMQFKNLPPPELTTKKVSEMALKALENMWKR
ncbi:MAG: hypothetical protein CMD81_04030 [Gammaproteobacteria bacterium]|nr:hypothetical protein [Gammaproteobacteria bacterium]HBF08606.1 hypothetical protein [Gammaproteobacteria bacterium]|tara:strand:+ start:51727 stop:52551 length:825 start_codon:yes stop_codon:yes gene_type:complete